MKSFSRITAFHAAILLVLALGASGCKSSQTPSSQTPDNGQASSAVPAQDQGDPANANVVPISNNTTGTTGAASTAATPAAEPAQAGGQANDQYSSNQYNEDNGYGQEPETYAQQPPPQLPEYQQPACPGEGYIWTPGYWAWASAGYYWVPGAWVQAPYVGALWTPGYWGWRGGRYAFYRGYWGRHVGYYGGINYGFGYVGFGYRGGYWRGNDFAYNRVVNNVNTTVIRNVYDYRITNVSETRVSYNGGSGGLQYRPRTSEIIAVHEEHNPPMAAQMQLRQEAQSNRQNFAEVNRGRPAMVVASHPVMAEHGIRPPAPVNYQAREQRPAEQERPAPNREAQRPQEREQAHPQQREQAHPQQREQAHPQQREQAHPPQREQAHPQHPEQARPQEKRPQERPQR